MGVSICKILTLENMSRFKNYKIIYNNLCRTAKTKYAIEISHEQKMMQTIVDVNKFLHVQKKV